MVWVTLGLRSHERQRLMHSCESPASLGFKLRKVFAKALVREPWRLFSLSCALARKTYPFETRALERLGRQLQVDGA